MSGELLKALPALLGSKLEEVTVVCGADTHQLHSAMLAVKSKFFAAATRVPLEENKTRRIVVHNVKPETFKKVVRFIYEDELELELEEGLDLGEMLAAADHFAMEGLKQMISAKVEGSISADSVFTISDLADSYRAKELLEACAQFVMTNSIALTKQEVVTHPGLVVALLAEKDKELGEVKKEIADIKEDIKEIYEEGPKWHQWGAIWYQWGEHPDYNTDDYEEDEGLMMEEAEREFDGWSD